MCSHSKNSQWALIQGLQPFHQDQEVRNGFKISQNPINTSLKIKVVREKGGKKEKKEGKYS